MKLRIIDLMDYYQGNPSVPLTPYRKRPSTGRENSETRKREPKPDASSRA